MGNQPTIATIKFTDESRDLARRGANAYAEAVLDQSRESSAEVVQTYEQAVARSSAQVARLQAELDGYRRAAARRTRAASRRSLLQSLLSSAGQQLQIASTDLADQQLNLVKERQYGQPAIVSLAQSPGSSSQPPQPRAHGAAGGRHRADRGRDRGLRVAREPRGACGSRVAPQPRPSSRRRSRRSRSRAAAAVAATRPTRRPPPRPRDSPPVAVAVVDGDTEAPVAGARVRGAARRRGGGAGADRRRGARRGPARHCRRDGDRAVVRAGARARVREGAAEVDLYDPRLQSPEYGGGPTRDRYVAGGEGPAARAASRRGRSRAAR